MNDVLAIILARPSSGRLPQKHLRKIGNKRMLDWVISRIPCDTIIATTKDGLDVYNSFDAKVMAPNIDENNTIGRIKEIVKAFSNIKYFFIVSGDCPVISTEIMEKLYNELNDFPQYDAARPVFTHHVGVEIVRADAINKLVDGEHFSITLSDLNELHVPIGDITDLPVRVTVDNLADLKFQNVCYDILGDNYNYEGILNLSRIHSNVFNINSHVSQKGVTEHSKNTYIITRGDSTIGLGHVARSVALAQIYSEIYNSNVRIFVNDDKMVKNYLKNMGYIEDLDFIVGLPVIDSEKFDDYIYITDTPEKTTLNYDEIYKMNPTYAVNQRLKYITKIIENDILVTFGKGKYRDFGLKIFNELPIDIKKEFVYDVDDLTPYLFGAKEIITVWSQSCREAIFLGKKPITYSANSVDDKVCKILHEKGYITYVGRMK